MAKRRNLLALVLVCALGFLGAGSYVLSQVATPVTGWAWSDNIGWVSLNCQTGGANSTNICATNNYGVSNTGGALSGYAWSDNIGWIQFGGLSGFPSGSGTTAANATVSGSTITGWARALAYADGWDGWIALSGTGYGVTTASCPTFNCNFAWGSDVIGWLSFNLGAFPITVTTQAASTVVASGATLNGTITGTGGANATVRGFAYGTSATLTTGVATTATNGSFDVGAYSSNIVSLTPSTTYYFRAYATNPNGTGLGTILSFTTQQDACTDISGIQDAQPPSCTGTAPNCVGAGQTWNGSACVAAPAVISNFRANPVRVRNGQTSTLYYTVTNPPASCTITGTNGFSTSVTPVSGVQGTKVTNAITSSTTFTLSCGSVIARVTVTVLPTYQEL